MTNYDTNKTNYDTALVFVKLSLKPYKALCFNSLSCLILSLWIAKQIFLQNVRIVGSTGCAVLTRADSGRFSDVGSSRNCVKTVWDGLSRIALEGKNWEIALSRSGSTLVLVSDVDLHLVSRWTMSSVGAG